jgi:hypothetical protein
MCYFGLTNLAGCTRPAACCTNPVHTTGTTPASRQPLSTASCTTCYGTSAYLFQCVSSVVHISACTLAVLTNFACSSDHNYRTTSRQLQATELFKLSRLVVVCLRFLWCQVRQRQLQVYLAVCTSCTNPVHVAATRTAGKQLQLHSSSCTTRQ